jgi:hypothetical protein
MFDPITIDQAADAYASLIIGLTALSPMFGVPQMDVAERTIEHCVDRGDDFSMKVADVVSTIKNNINHGIPITDPVIKYIGDVVQQTEPTETDIPVCVDFDLMHETAKQDSLIAMKEDFFKETIIVGSLTSGQYHLILMMDND